MATLEEMLIEVHDNLGRPTDLEIYDENDDIDYSLDGTRRLMEWINNGQNRIAAWKQPRYSTVMIPSLFRRMNFLVKPFTAEVVEVSGDWIEIDTIDAEVAQIKNWIVEHDGKRRLVTDYQFESIRLNDSLELEAGDELTFYKRHWTFVSEDSANADYEITLDPVSEIESVQRVTDLRRKWQIHRGLTTDYYPLTMDQIGEPSAYIIQGNSLVFDVAPKKETWFELEYYARPRDLQYPNDISELPEPYHEAVVLYATWWGLRRSQEWDGAYATKKDLVDYMQTVRGSYEMNSELEDGFLWIDEGTAY